jgi:hypothetical protein
MCVCVQHRVACQPAREIEHADGAEEAAAPHPVDHRHIDAEHPQRHEPRHGGELHAFGEGLHGGDQHVLLAPHAGVEEGQAGDIHQQQRRRDQQPAVSPVSTRPYLFIFNMYNDNHKFEGSRPP